MTNSIKINFPWSAWISAMSLRKKNRIFVNSFFGTSSSGHFLWNHPYKFILKLFKQFTGPFHDVYNYVSCRIWYIRVWISAMNFLHALVYYTSERTVGTCKVNDLLGWSEETLDRLRRKEKVMMTVVDEDQKMIKVHRLHYLFIISSQMLVISAFHLS